jgi:hypothetical protein
VVLFWHVHTFALASWKCQTILERAVGFIHRESLKMPVVLC